MGIRRRIGTSAKSSPKIFGTEFLIQNHSDIIGTIIVLIALGLIFEPTSRFSAKFVTIQHNITSPTITFETGLPMEYTYGFNDIFCILFYSLVCIVAHGVIQLYLLDRSARKLHMSKIKHSKFNESGQLLTFYIISVLWAIELIRRDRFTKKSFIEVLGGNGASVDSHMTHGVKLYFILQIVYWLHCFPEFYLQRVRKEELTQRINYVSLYLTCFLGAYLFDITRLSLVLSLLHYIGEAAFHSAQLLYFRQSEHYQLVFRAWNALFVGARLISITLSILVLVLGLGSGSISPTPTINSSQSNIFRYLKLVGILLVQIYLMWRYLVFHLGRIRPLESETSEKKSKPRKQVTINTD